MVRRALAMLGMALAVLPLVAMPSVAAPPAAAAVQVLTWTAGDSITGYLSAPTTATAGSATVVFENSTATGNTTGMPHTLTFDTSTPGYNHDVTLNILASPFDASNGRHEAQITLTPGRYRYFCAIQGHQMVGELVVTAGSDTTPPTVSATVTGDRDNNGAYLGSATVTLSATDAESGVDRIEYSLDGAAFARYTAPVVVSVPGAHMLHYKATDVAGNTSPERMESFTVVVRPDTTPPTVSATVTGDRDNNGAYIGSATVTISATDTGSGVATVEYEVDDTGFQPYTAPVVVTRIGDHAVQYRATDVAGNVSPTGSVPFRVVEPAPVDTTPPTVSATVTGDRDNNGAYLGSATVALSATDAESGVDRIEYSLDGAAFARYSAPVVVSALGAHMVHYRATDRVGNTSVERMESFTVVARPDTTPPAVSAAVTGDRDNNGAYLGSATVTLSATDAESGVDRIEYSLDGAAFARYSAPVVVSALGAHMVHYRATDRAGNTSPERMESFTVVASPDRTPPTTSAGVSGDRDNNGNYVGTATVTISASDVESGVDRIEYSLDGAAFARYTAPIVVGSVGAHMLHYKATDVAGNTSPEKMVSFTVVAPPVEDRTPPTVSAQVSGHRDGNGDYIDSATVTITASDSQSGVASVEYAVDDGGFAVYHAPVAVGAAGPHTVRYRATDVAGNVSPVGSVSFRVVEPGPDACPDSDTRATVIIGGIDSEVANVDTGNGCTINDLVDEHGHYADHASFVRHVDAVTDALVVDGILTRRDKGSIVRAAARSDIGN